MKDLLPSEYTNGPILNDLGIFQTLTGQNANKHPQNSTTKPEHSQRSGFLVLFCHIVKYVLHRMLTNVGLTSYIPHLPSFGLRLLD